MRPRRSGPPQYKIDDGWLVTECPVKPTNNHVSETIFYTGTGWLAVRGAIEEGWTGDDEHSDRGTYVAGYYTRRTVAHPEPAVGYNTHECVLLTAPDATLIQVYANGELCVPGPAKKVGTPHERCLDMKSGRVTRKFRALANQSGLEVEVCIVRQAHWEHKHGVTFSVNVTPIPNADVVDGGAAVDIKVVCTLDGRSRNRVGHADPRYGAGSSVPTCDTITAMVAPTGIVKHVPSTGVALGVAVAHSVAVDGVVSDTAATVSTSVVENESHGVVVHTFEFSGAGSTCSVDQHVWYELGSAADEDPCCVLRRAESAVCELRRLGLERLLQEQDAAVSAFWRDADVEVEGDVELQQGLRFNLLALRMSFHDNIASKGLSGEGYGGHYFWDTEMFVAPFFLFSSPEVCRRLIQFRIQTLPQARERARALSFKQGALFPWRTIDGTESSSYYPAGTAEIHVNPDIAHFIWKYVMVTGDESILREGAAEVLFETSRVMVAWGTWEGAAAFHLHGVTGPDEYNVLVDDNFYTNIITRHQLRYTVAVMRGLQRTMPAEDYGALLRRLGTDAIEPELEMFQKCADMMYIPPPCADAVRPQDASILTKKPWPLEDTARPLLLHHHPLVIHRHQICKQADLVLAMALWPEEFESDADEASRTYDFYNAITTHDSSLSMCVFSTVAARLGKDAVAANMFSASARCDLDDLQDNTGHGIHAASMAGTWQCVVHGFAGMHIRNSDGALLFNPRLPSSFESDVTRVSFRVKYRGASIGVVISQHHVRYTLLAMSESPTAASDHLCTFWHKDIKLCFATDRQTTATFALSEETLRRNDTIGLCPAMTAETHSRGLFAQCALQKGELLEVAPCLPFDKSTYTTHISQTLLEHYVFTYSGGMLLALGLGSMFNHNDPPNVDYRVDAKSMVIRYYTARDILPGEELCIYYGPSLGFEAWPTGVVPPKKREFI